jgi:hypothetical protein
MISRVLLGAISSALIALALACSGGNDSNDSAASESAGSNPALVNFSESTAKLAELKSFRFDLAMKLDLGGFDAGALGAEDEMGAAFASALMGLLGDIRAEGAFVAPDGMDVKLALGGQQMGYIQIGEQAWVNDGTGWEATTAPEGLGFGESPADLLSEFLPQDVLRAARTSSENVNGVEATRYSFDKQAIEQAATEMGETVDLDDVSEANLDVWLTEGNIPVKVLMSIAGKDETGQALSVQLEANVRDINSDSIQIKAPI